MHFDARYLKRDDYVHMTILDFGIFHEKRQNLTENKFIHSKLYDFHLLETMINSKDSMTNNKMLNTKLV